MTAAGKTDRRSRKRIGKYVVTGRIGRGGMGMVYRAFDEVLERELAVKTLTVEGTLELDSRRRFEIEAKAAAKLQHPNIVTVFELGEERGIPFIAMELLPGVDLETLLRSNEPLLLQEKLDIMIQVCRGLAYAHEHRIIHRDVKPSNIRLLGDGTVKILDFGIAKLGGTALTQSGMMVGTVHYMSPEQIRGRPLDGRSDVFSVGVILYELLAGQRPFPAATATEVLYKIVHQTAPPLPEDLEPASRRVQSIVDRALAKDPQDRYPSAAHMAEDLASVLAEQARTQPPVPADAPGVVNQARRLLKDGRVEEGIAELRTLVERVPHFADGRRALRTAVREAQGREQPPEPEEQEFPELDATFQAPPTQRASETPLRPPQAPTVLAAAPSSEAGLPRATPVHSLIWVCVGMVVVAAVAGIVLLLKSDGSQTAPSSVRLALRSQPTGARLIVDGRDMGVVTDTEITLPADAKQVSVTFRKEGYRDESRTVALPLREGEALSATLVPATASVLVSSEPSGATVTLDGRRTGTTPLALTVDASADHRLTVSMDGHASQEVLLPAGRIPLEVKAKLAAAGPLVTVTVSSSYPIDVLWKGRVMARHQVSPSLTLPVGRQTLALVSADFFLKANLTVDVRADAPVGAAAPGVGKINIKANPDNCQIFIDGRFADYPPLLDKPVAAGSHTVLFKWPDGTQREDVLEVPAGRSVYLTGRKERD